MHFIGKAFLRGLATVLPVALTLYLVYVLAVGAERLMGKLLKLILPTEYYWPGMGLILALIAITAIGIVVRLPWMGLLVRLNDAIMSRIPLIKTIYSTIRDFTEFLTRMRDQADAGRPVRVRLWDEIELIGLVTDADHRQFADPDGDEKNLSRSLVYLPMSYQLGGYTLSLNKERLKPLNMSMEDALKYVVTAGIQSSDESKRTRG